jgi:hypothetical protein
MWCGCVVMSLLRCVAVWCVVGWCCVVVRCRCVVLWCGCVVLWCGCGVLCEGMALCCVVVCVYFLGSQQNWIFEIQIMQDEMFYVRLNTDVNKSMV